MRSVRYKMNYTVDSQSGLFLVDYDNFNIYQSKADKYLKKKRSVIPDDQLDLYELDVNKSQSNYDKWLKTFQREMYLHFKKLRYDNDRKYYKEHVILSDSMFSIQIEDDGWACAVEIAAKPGQNHKQQKSEFAGLYKDTGRILLNHLDTIYLREGSLKARPVTKNTLDSEIDRYIQNINRETPDIPDSEKENNNVNGKIPSGPDV